MILIISHQKDGHSQAVINELEKRGHGYTLLDLANFPAKDHLSISFNQNEYLDSTFDSVDSSIKLSDYKSVWWRRPQPFVLHKELIGQTESSFTMNECYSAVNGMWLLMDAYWINDPVKDEAAARKVYQLKVATQSGLTIPQTLVTSSPANAKEFIEHLGVGNVIYKSFSATEQAWRETRLVKEEELQKTETVKYAPVIFQECIHADIDLRITVIGDEIFAAGISSQDTSYKVDYRMTYHEAKIVAHKLPNEVCNCLLKLMKRLGLVYGAIDMRLRPNGEYVFLEINPAGQWLFMETPTGLPITCALTDQLIKHDCGKNENMMDKYHEMFDHVTKC